MISIIIPCKNRIEKLELCLKSIYEALDFASLTENSEFEIIVINDHSDIGFRDKVLNLFPYIKIIDSDGIGPGYARNLGIKNSNGNYLFFTDSDCVVSKDWIMEGIKMFNKTNSLVIQGVPWLFQKNTNVYMGNQEEKLYKTMFSTYLYNGNKTKMTDSRNLLMKADIVKILGDEVFSKSMTKAAAESRVFGSRCLNKNIEILFDINLKIYHEDSNNIEEVCKQKYRHGSGRIEIWKDVPEFEYLKNRYFDNPIKKGNDIDYILPSHFCFLLGYFQSLNDIDKYNEFINFSKNVFKNYKREINDYAFLSRMINNYGKI